MIDTKIVKDRRPLRFETFDEAVRDAESLAGADRNGKLRATGNWTLGQALGHVAFWARAPFDGYRPTPRMPLPFRLLIPLMKNRFLNKGLPTGARIPGIPGGTFGIEPQDTDGGLADLRAAFDRLIREMPGEPNPVLGTLSHDDWIKLNLRHAELHQSFFHPA
ncbi:MAG TPA: DUF1569 domain-containing protein [Lacipirellulaceae bacterium]|jgi:hypothetical protein